MVTVRRDDARAVPSNPLHLPAFSLGVCCCRRPLRAIVVQCRVVAALACMYASRAPSGRAARAGTDALIARLSCDTSWKPKHRLSASGCCAFWLHRRRRCMRPCVARRRHASIYHQLRPAWLQPITHSPATSMSQQVWSIRAPGRARGADAKTLLDGVLAAASRLPLRSARARARIACKGARNLFWATVARQSSSYNKAGGQAPRACLLWARSAQPRSTSLLTASDKALAHHALAPRPCAAVARPQGRAQRPAGDSAGTALLCAWTASRSSRHL